MTNQVKRLCVKPVLPLGSVNKDFVICGQYLSATWQELREINDTLVCWTRNETLFRSFLVVFSVPLHICIISIRLYVTSAKCNPEDAPHPAEPDILLRDLQSCKVGLIETEERREAEARVLSEARRRGTSPYLCSDYTHQTQITLISIPRLQALFIKKQHSLATGPLS